MKLNATGSWRIYELLLGKRQGTPWTGQQSIAGLTRKDRQQITLTFIPTADLETPVNLTSMFSHCDTKPEYLERTNRSTARTCKLHTECPSQQV